RSQHRVRRAARAAQAGIDQRKAGKGERNEQNGQDRERGRGFGERRNGWKRHPLSPRTTRWERTAKISPSASTPTPASTKPVRGSAEERSATAASAIPHPASRSRKPASLIRRARSEEHTSELQSLRHLV